MFTGIIEALGEIAAVEPSGGDLRLRVRAAGLELGDMRPGDSIAVNGCCLTATDLSGGGFWCDLSAESLSLTTLGELAPGSEVNLERPLAAGARLSGHLVLGHIDGIGEVLSAQPEGRSTRWTLRAPQSLAKYIARKGSIAVDGVSLTIAAARGPEFELSIIPHTAQHTLFPRYRPGTRVNLEADIIARYLERLMQKDA